MYKNCYHANHTHTYTDTQMQSKNINTTGELVLKAVEILRVENLL